MKDIIILGWKLCWKTKKKNEDLEKFYVGKQRRKSNSMLENTE
jgi:hypothetical protein